MLKHTFRILSLLLINFIFNSTVSAQSWSNTMKDTSLSFSTRANTIDTYWKTNNYEKGKGYKPYKRWEYFMQFRMNDKGVFNSNIDRVREYHKIQKEINKQKSLGAAGKWTQIGPFGPSNGTGSGRTNCIDFHPTNNKIILIGAPSGGIWRSTNGGNSWTTNTDDLASIGISDICFAPSNGNIVYVATGDKDASDTYTHGILKSTDAGINWTLTSWTKDYTYRKQVYRIVVDPTNADIVYATTSLGLYKTTDGGTTWNRLKLGTFLDIELKPGNSNTIYISTSKYIYKSTNGGTSFTKTPFIASSTSNRLEMATTAADPNYLYVLASKNSNDGFAGIYLSTNSGTSFSTKATSPNILGWNKSGSDQGGQGWYDLSLTVSPTNKQILFVGGVNIWKSTNGGSSWAINSYWQNGYGVEYVHSDIHMLKYNNLNGTIWACSDGGISRTINNGNSWSQKNSGLSIAQMYRMGGSKTISTKIITGWQDNGSSLLSNSWNYVLGGDGMECLISNNNNNVIFASIYNGDIRRSNNNGSSWVSVSSSISETGAWVTPYIQHPTNSNLLYAGYTNIWKSTNIGNSWTKISNFSTSYKINALASAPLNNQIIWAANASNLYHTTDGGQNWITNTANIGQGKITSIAINKNNSDIVWITKSGFISTSKVYKTTDGGTSWTNITGSLPNYPVNTIVNDANDANNALYIGTDIGIYYRDDILGDWIPYMKDLPNVIVQELEIFEQGNKIRAATFGRGLWESVLYPMANSIEKSNNTNSNVKIYPNPAKDVIYIKINNNLDKNSQLTVFNNIGALLYSKTILNKKEIALNISNFPRGIYFFNIISNSQSTVNKIIIK